MCGSPTSPCWSTNLWYDPDTDPTRWDDWTIFNGEKEITWARQWISEIGSVDWNLSPSCVVLSGTSTGAIYGSSVAFGPDRSWPGSITLQSKRDTRVSGLVFFSPVSWIPAYSSSFPAPHWPTSTDSSALCSPTLAPGTCPESVTGCYNKRPAQFSSFSLDPGIIEAGSVSRWVRDLEPTIPGTQAGEYMVPVFLASGDGAADGNSGFQRDANAPIFQDDYNRQGVAFGGSPFGSACGSTEDCDPDLFQSNLTPPAPSSPLRLHDAWFALNMRLDLAIMDEALGSSFHSSKSRLYLHEDVEWERIPEALSTTGMPPTDASEVPLVDGSYSGSSCSPGQCSLVPTACCSYLNCDLAPVILGWLEDEVLSNGATTAPGVGHRNGGTNPDCYRATTGQVGGRDVTMTVYMDQVPPEYDSAVVFSFATSVNVTLGSGQVLFCFDGGMELLSLSTKREDSSTGTVAWDVPVSSAVMAGQVICTQALISDMCQEDAGPVCTAHTGPFSTFLLSNAQDITILP